MIGADEIVLRVALAAVAGGLIGFEREFSDQPAGFRTHILVALGANLFTLVGAYGVDATGGFDPTRIAAQVVTGIGFLGAGAIIRQGVSIRGLTTAASLWVTAAIGTGIGLGHFTGALTTTAVTVVSLWGLKRLERQVFPRLRRGRYRIEVTLAPDALEGPVIDTARAEGAELETVVLRPDDAGHRRVVLTTRLPQEMSPDILAERLDEVDGVTAVDWFE